jgi:molybdenum cofactor biosynthesis enzyme MoaA
MEDKKFCAGCQKWRLLSEGQTVVRNKRNRWICNVCLARKNDSPYTTRKQVGDKDV